MKCEHAEQALLLKDSGELGGWKNHRLQRHLAGCPACRTYQATLRETRLALHAMPAPALTARARSALLDAARPDRRDSISLAPRPTSALSWRPAWALAGLALLLAVGIQLRSRNATPAVVAQNQALTVDEAVDAELDQLQQLLVASLDESPDAGDVRETLDENTLASELLALQETL